MKMLMACFAFSSLKAAIFVLFPGNALMKLKLYSTTALVNASVGSLLLSFFLSVALDLTICPESPLLPLAPAERVPVALCSDILSKCIRIVIVAFGSSPILVYGASRTDYVGLPPKPAWGFHPQTPSLLRAGFKIP